MTPDVNVLVAAYREDHVHHREAQAWLTGVLASCYQGGTMRILPMVAVGFIRVVTNRRIFPGGPTSTSDAMSFIQSLLRVPGVEIHSLGAEWASFDKLCQDTDLAGNSISDGWIAAAVRAGGLHLVTFDTDFKHLLGASELTVLRRGMKINETRAKYIVHRPQRKAA